MSFLFDNLFQKQNPELASEMAKRGLIFDRIKHRWVKNPENRAQPKTAPKVVRSGKKGRPPGKTSGRTPRPLKERKWKIGKYVPHDKELYSYRTGSNIGSVLVPEAIEGTASIAKVGSDGRILAWLMRHEPVEDALKFIKEREKIDSYDKD